MAWKQQLEGGSVEYLFKILVVGDIGVGKTSIIKRIVHSTFAQHYKSTVSHPFMFEVSDIELDRCGLCPQSN